MIKYSLSPLHVALAPEHPYSLAWGLAFICLWKRHCLAPSFHLGPHFTGRVLQTLNPSIPICELAALSPKQFLSRDKAEEPTYPAPTPAQALPSRWRWSSAVLPHRHCPMTLAVFAWQGSSILSPSGLTEGVSSDVRSDVSSSNSYCLPFDSRGKREGCHLLREKS